MLYPTANNKLSFRETNSNDKIRFLNRRLTASKGCEYTNIEVSAEKVKKTAEEKPISLLKYDLYADDIDTIKKYTNENNKIIN